MILDLRFALRLFRRTAVTTATMIVVLALGIGVNSAMYTALSAFLFRPAPGIPRDPALVWIRPLERPGAYGFSPGPRFGTMKEYRELATHVEVFSSVAASTWGDLVLDQGASEGGARSQMVYFVTPGYFSTLGVRVALGKGLPTTELDAGDPGALTAVISDELWRRKFGQDPSVIGRTVRVNGVKVAIAGVAPPRFHGPSTYDQSELMWIPLSAKETIVGSEASFGDPVRTYVARLRPGVSNAAATRTASSVARMHPSVYLTRGGVKVRPSADVVPLLPINEQAGRKAQDEAYAATVAGISLLVLVITCLNVSALLVGRAFSRRGEIATRLSLGAPRLRVVRQLLTETSLVAVAGGMLGLVLHWWLVAVVSRWIGESDIPIRWDTVAFTVACALGTGLLFGIAPALHATRQSVAEAIKGSAAAVSVSRSWLQRSFVVAQIGLTLPLLVGVGVLLTDVVREMAGPTRPAIRDQVISVELSYVVARPRDSTGRSATSMADRFRSLPGVVTVVNQAQMWQRNTYHVHPADRGVGAPAEDFDVGERHAEPGYLTLTGAIVQGRDFTEQDMRSGGVVIIDTDLARRLWGTTDPIGKRFQGPITVQDMRARGEPVSVTASGKLYGAPQLRDLVIVGVVDPAVMDKRYDPKRAPVYLPGSGASGYWFVRTQGPGTAFTRTLRSVANREFPVYPLDRVETLAQQDAAGRRSLLEASAGPAAAGLLILLLVSVGLYGVVSFAVGQRTREIGIRMAIGASAGEVVAMFFRSGLMLGVIGLVIGIPLSVGAMRVIAATLDGPRVYPVPVAVVIGVIVIGVSAFAAWLPARRAARVDPMIALRSE